MSENNREILEGLAPLFKKAEKEGLWFYSTYQHLWFSPQELKNEHLNGRFIWDAVNWTLRSPHEKLKQLEDQAVELSKEIEGFKRRIKNY
ncbi:hypothetical protein [Lysinibacillus sphaericus]|uniref:hypothetical protein n=1 Tax=Lysinibacillus sphaericus TaxID=1421 RepID=UPI002E1E46A3|nr:hypothetical protein [Lysinibacillus sphaericus]